MLNKKVNSSSKKYL